MGFFPALKKTQTKHNEFFIDNAGASLRTGRCRENPKAV